MTDRQIEAVLAILVGIPFVVAMGIVSLEGGSLVFAVMEMLWKGVMG